MLTKQLSEKSNLLDKLQSHETMCKNKLEELKQAQMQALEQAATRENDMLGRLELVIKAQTEVKQANGEMGAQVGKIQQHIEAEVNTLREDLESAKGDNADLTAKYEEEVGRADQFEDDVERLENELDTKDEYIQRLETELQSLRDKPPHDPEMVLQLEETQEELRVLEENKRTREAELQSVIDGQKQSSEAQMQQLQARCAELTEQLRNRNAAEATAVEAAVSMTRQEMSATLTEATEVSNAELHKAQSNYDNAMKELTKCRSELAQRDDSSHALQSAEAELVKMEKKLAAAVKAQTQTQLAKDQESATVKELKQKLAEEKGRCQKLELELSSRRQSMMHTSFELSEEDDDGDDSIVVACAEPESRRSKRVRVASPQEEEGDHDPPTIEEEKAQRRQVAQLKSIIKPQDPLTTHTGDLDFRRMQIPEQNKTRESLRGIARSKNVVEGKRSGMEQRLATTKGSRTGPVVDTDTIRRAAKLASSSKPNAQSINDKARPQTLGAKHRRVDNGQEADEPPLKRQKLAEPEDKDHSLEEFALGGLHLSDIGSSSSEGNASESDPPFVPSSRPQVKNTLSVERGGREASVLNNSNTRVPTETTQAKTYNLRKPTPNARAETSVDEPQAAEVQRRRSVATTAPKQQAVRPENENSSEEEEEESQESMTFSQDMGQKNQAAKVNVTLSRTMGHQSQNNRPVSSSQAKDPVPRNAAQERRTTQPAGAARGATAARETGQHSLRGNTTSARQTVASSHNPGQREPRSQQVTASQTAVASRGQAGECRNAQQARAPRESGNPPRRASQSSQAEEESQESMTFSQDTSQNRTYAPVMQRTRSNHAGLPSRGIAGSVRTTGLTNQNASQNRSYGPMMQRSKSDQAAQAPRVSTSSSRNTSQMSQTEEDSQESMMFSQDINQNHGPIMRRTKSTKL